MASYTWLIIAAVLVASELASGTFYLLMLAVAAFLAWLAQLLGMDFLAQSLIFLCSAAFLVALVYRIRKNHQSAYNPVNDLDAGAVVDVSQWHNGTGLTRYRGAQWQVVLADQSQTPYEGAYTIIRIDSNCLVVSPITR